MEAQLVRPLRTIGLLALGALIAMLAFSAASAKADTEAATGIRESAATLNATATGKGWTAYKFEYGTTTSYTHSTEWKLNDAGIREVIEGLEPKTTYHYRVYYVTKEEDTAGSDKTFTTEATHSPKFEAEEFPVSLFAYDETESVTFVINKRPYKCDTHVLTKTLSNSTWALTGLTGSYEGCTHKETILGVPITWPVTVEMNGCTFSLFAGFSSETEPPNYPARLGLSCPKGQTLTVRLKSPTTEEDLCIYKFGSQSGSGFGIPGVDLENAFDEFGYQIISGDVNLPLKYTLDKTPNACGEETGTASYTSSFDMVALNEAEYSTGIYMDGQ
jgi:hypothetical protein